MLGTRSIFTLAALFVLAGCSSSTTWGWYVINPNTPAGWTNIKFLVGGMGSTILISIIAAFLSITIGLIVEVLMRTYYESQNKKTYEIREIYEGSAKDKKMA